MTAASSWLLAWAAHALGLHMAWLAKPLVEGGLAVLNFFPAAAPGLSLKRCFSLRGGICPTEAATSQTILLRNLGFLLR